MPDPTGRWINEQQWRCPACGAENGGADGRCQRCLGSVRPSDEEPIRPPDPLDLIGPGQSAEPKPTIKWAGMQITLLKGRVKVLTRRGLVVVRVENITGHAGLTPDQADQLADDLHMFARLAREDDSTHT